MTIAGQSPSAEPDDIGADMSSIPLLVRVAEWLCAQGLASPGDGTTGGGVPGIREAGALLTLLRNPTDAMVEAGGSYVETMGRIAVDGVWSSMIDAAVAERY